MALTSAFILLNILTYNNSSKVFWFIISESVEFGLCISVACLPLGFLKVKNDLWSRFCFRLSDSFKCTIRKFDSFNKLASVDRVIFSVEDLLLQNSGQFKLVSITGGQKDIAASPDQPQISHLIQAKRAAQILENFAILDFNGDKKTGVKSAIEKFFFHQVFGTSCKCSH